MELQKVIKNLEKNNMHAIYLTDKAAALSWLQEELPTGAIVTHGGSMTLDQIGIIDLLKSGKYHYLDRTADAKGVYQKTVAADFYLTSANAITETGTLYNVDGNSNRVSAISFGPKRVLVFAGINKIVPTLEDAVKRVKTVAAPLNAKRLNCNTYCAQKGACVSLLNERPKMTDGCDSEQRICCNYLVSARQRCADRITVILIGEFLGY